MTDRRGSRFLVEVLFLLALTVALTLTNLPPLEIAGIMFVGWVIVAVFEWVAWREEPHYGSGLPPRYYVPQVNLPPAQPLEPVVNLVKVVCKRHHLANVRGELHQVELVHRAQQRVDELARRMLLDAHVLMHRAAGIDGQHDRERHR